MEYVMNLSSVHLAGHRARPSLESWKNRMEPPAWKVRLFSVGMHMYIIVFHTVCQFAQFQNCIARFQNRDNACQLRNCVQLLHNLKMVHAI